MKLRNWAAYGAVVAILASSPASAVEKAVKAAKKKTKEAVKEAVSEVVPPQAPPVKTAQEVVPAQETTSPVTAPVSQAYGPTQGIIPGGDILVGAKASFGVHPTPFLFGLEAKWRNMVGVGLDYGYLPSMSYSNVSVGLNSMSGTVRYFPWQRAMFIGMAVGSQSSTINATETKGTTVTTGKLDVSTLFLAPHIGWRWMWENGFLIGMEFGWQFSLSSTSTTTLSGTSASLLSDLNKAGDAIARASLPRIAIFQVGYMF